MRCSSRYTPGLGVGGEIGEVGVPLVTVRGQSVLNYINHSRGARPLESRIKRWRSFCTLVESFARR